MDETFNKKHKLTKFVKLDSRNFSNSKPNENSLISGDMSYEKNKTQLPLLDDAVIGKLKEINNLPNSNQGANIKKIFPKVLSNSLLQEREEFRRIEKRDKINDTDDEDSDLDNKVNVKFIILPEHPLKKAWDLYIAIILIYSAIITPYRISFYDIDLRVYVIIDYLIDFSFFIDIILNFFTAYTNREDNLIKNRKKIVINYLKTWFVIDFLSTLPVNLWIDESETTTSGSRISKEVSRIARLPKIYRLFRLAKLFRMFKIAKKGNINRLTRMFLEKLKVNANIERLIYFILAFLLMNHFSACIWYLIAKFEDFEPDSWVVRLGFIDQDPLDLYIIAFYWNIATVTTVGYGDVNAGTSAERAYNLFIMSFGVLMYSFAIGSLTSIVSTMDAKTSEMNQKLQTLYSIKHEYKLDQEIYDKVRKIIKYDLSKNQKEKMNFLQELPNKLRIELSRVIHDNIIKKMIFFRDKPELIAFVAPLLKPIKFSQNEVLYKIDDYLDEMYFVAKGTVSLFLGDDYGNKEIKEVKKNHNFGEIEMCLNDKLSHNIKIKSRTAELYILKKEDFLRLSVNFKDIIQLFLHNSLLKYVKFNDEKKKIIKEYEDKYGIVKHNSSSATIKDKEKEIIKLDQIREETDDEENLNQGDSSDNESSDGEISLKRSRIKKTRTNDHTRLSDYEPSSEKNMSDINNNNKIDLEIQTDAEPKKVERKSNIYSHSPKNFSPNRLNNTSNDPIKEMNNHVELVKNELFIGFSEKVDRIIQFLESNNINFGEENQQNPMYYLQKLRTTKEISDRNEIIEELESVLSKYY